MINKNIIAFFHIFGTKLINIPNMAKYFLQKVYDLP